MRRSLGFRMLGAVVASAALATAGAAGAASDRLLTNLHGDVTYLAYPQGESHALAPSASISLSDDDVAATGARSMAAIVLPDSSRVLLASDTTVKLDAFDGAANGAHFVVAQGKLRFRVEHPSGAEANYVFTTPTAQIGIRGTVGDISVDAFDGVRVNVYRLSSPDLPVRVTMIDGQVFEIPAGQKIWMRWQSGKLVGKVLPLTQAEIDRFSELGPPPSPSP